MPNQDPWTTLDAALAGLRPHDADPERTERTRARCLARLAVRRRRRERGRARLRGSWRRLEPVLALSLGTLYLAVVVRQAVALLR